MATTGEAADTASATTAAAPASGRRPGQPSADSPAAVAPLSERDELRLDILRNARHHEDRERFFDRIHRWVMFGVVLAGTAAFADLWSLDGTFGLIAAAAGLVDLVFDVSGRARCHAGLKREAFRMLADVEGGADLQAVRHRQTISYGDEPLSSTTVDAVAYNSAMLSMGRDPLDLIKISRWQRLFRHLLPDGTSLRTYRELDELPPEALTRRP